MIKTWNDYFSEIKTAAAANLAVEAKNATIGNAEQWRYLLAYGTDYQTTVFPIEAYRFYNKIHPVRKAVDKIAKTFAGLPIGLAIKGQDDIDTEHEIIKLIKKPGLEVDGNDLLRELVISMLLTEESWPIFRGNINKLPASISYVRPYNVCVVGEYDKADGFPNVLQTDSPRDCRFYYKTTINGQLRYFDDKNANQSMNEIIPIINTVNLIDQFRGLSRLGAIKKSLDQHWDGDVHNAALLKSGMRPSAILTPKDIITDKQRELVKHAIGEMQGPGAAGGIMVLPVQFERAQIMESNREADYINLIDRLENRMFSMYDIPLPLVNQKFMTLNNLQTAEIAFYTGPIDTMCKELFPGLLNAFMNRLTGNRMLANQRDLMYITYNPNSIKALQPLQAERMKNLRDTYSMTTEEIRATAGYGDIPEGQFVLGPATYVKLPTANTPDDYLGEQ
jgi:HK97 family phage portal protein